MINSIKKICGFFRDIFVWLTPFLVFIVFLALTVYFLGGHLIEYIDLLKILIWPVTVLVGLFFFRKVVTYMFFSMDGFNFFGVKGELKNVHELISEEVQKRLLIEKEEQVRKEEMDDLEKKLNNKSATADENLKVAQDIFKLYQEYKKENQTKIDDLNIKIKEISNGLNNSILNKEMGTPVLSGEESIDLGSGEKIGDLSGTEPAHE